MQKTLFIFIILTLNTSFAAKADIQSNQFMNSSKSIQNLWAQYTEDSFEAISFAHKVFSQKSRNSVRDELRLKEMYLTLSAAKKSIIVKKKLSFESAISIVSDLGDYKNLEVSFSDQNKKMISLAQEKLNQLAEFKIKTKKEIQDLYSFSPDLSRYQDGQYKDSLKLFLFCRKDRSYPCLFVMKDIFENTVRNQDNSIWNLPALAYSRHLREYNQTNGNTPSGVHTIDSVMPEANKPKWYGQYRRAILNWIPANQDNSDLTTISLLPKSSHTSLWWKQASVARDIGRKWLRIHGTGNVNEDTNSNYYPHFGTSGCISTREGAYAKTYTDQRILLDKMMESMQMAPLYINEPQIKGILYVVELDDKKKAVQLKDLENLELF